MKLFVEMENLKLPTRFRSLCVKIRALVDELSQNESYVFTILNSALETKSLKSRFFLVSLTTHALCAPDSYSCTTSAPTNSTAKNVHFVKFRVVPVMYLILRR